jgi:pyridoxamine 5'-phosphate oxidase
MNKNELIAFLKANPIAYLATVENGSPRVRAMAVYKIEEDGILIQTWKSKDLGKQLNLNPEAELCFNNHEAGFQVRVRGVFELVEDPETIRQSLADRPFLKQFVEKGEEIALFRMKEGLAHTWNMASNFEPKTFTRL